jgi:ribonucleoside-diphosphate reductase alpha chain
MKNTEVITISAPNGLEVALQAWAANNNVTIVSYDVLRVIDQEFSLRVLTGNPDDAPGPVAEERFPDYSRDGLLTEFGKATLKDRYLLPSETSPQDLFLRAATAFADNEAHARRLYDYASRLWFMYATPVMSNAPIRTGWSECYSENFKPAMFEAKKRGLPISCFLNMPDDSREGLTEHYTENAWLSSYGGGIGGYWGAIRSNGCYTANGSQSSGIIPFMKVVDSEVLAFAQGVTRRASYAAYLDISHPEILEFLEMRKPTGGDVNRKCLNLHHGVNIPDAFMRIIENCMQDTSASDDWPLVDPHTKAVTEVVSAKMLWERILNLRLETGEPYLHFVDASNRALPEAQKRAGLRVHQSNLCSEITLPTSKDRTAVCCLSSVNLENFDEWKDNPQFIEDLIRMLDNVIEYFIQNAPPQLGRAIYSASMERSIGLGAMGFHALLQRKGTPFESALATSLNRRVFSHIKSAAERATVKLAMERGACPDAGGEMRRNMHLLAIAPNASTSIICGETSPSIEPYRANAFTRKTSSGSALAKNKYLETVLEAYDANTEDVWRSITVNGGSVQHLDFLPEHVRDVFKTAMEIDQRWLVEHAAHRQEYVCQAQSLNLFLPYGVPIRYLHLVHFMAWKSGLKSLYYLRSEPARTAYVVSQEAMAEPTTCLSCEG